MTAGTTPAEIAADAHDASTGGHRRVVTITETRSGSVVLAVVAAWGSIVPKS
jgi:hypothetical protein